MRLWLNELATAAGAPCLEVDNKVVAEIRFGVLYSSYASCV